MKLKLLPSSFSSNGTSNLEQRLSCYVLDDAVALDAGSLALALNDELRARVRDIIITHTHLDHIATLPIFIDDVFDLVREPICIHATPETVEQLERDIFNWHTYPRFSELSNDFTPVMRYQTFAPAEAFTVRHLRVTAVTVNHAVPTVGVLLESPTATIAYTADTAATHEFWQVINQASRLDALLIETSFPDSMQAIADQAKHFTPATLNRELDKLNRHTEIYVVHIKPCYRQQVIAELQHLNRPNLHILEPGRDYLF